MNDINPILDSNNESIAVTGYFGALAPITSINGIPLGSVAESAIGEIFVKVGVIGGIFIAAGSAIIGKVGIDQTTPGVTNGVQLTGIQLTPVSVLATTGATIAAGKKHIEFIFSSTYTGNINGIAYAGAADSAQSFDAPPGYTFAAMAYTVTAGSVRIITF